MFTTMDQQQRLLADDVERILSEPFTLHGLAILSPSDCERLAASKAIARHATDARLTSRLGTRIDDPTRIRWGEEPRVQGPRGARGDLD